jgi:hypothetical protein
MANVKRRLADAPADVIVATLAIAASSDDGLASQWYEDG